MSAKTMGQVWDLDIPHNQLLVLLAMTDHADHSGGNMYPSMGLIAHKTGYSERQVKRVIKALVSAGILILEKIGNGTVNVYRVDFSNAKKKEPYKTRDKMSPPQEATHDKMSQEGGHSYVTPTHDIAMSPEPSLEPSLNYIDDSKVITIPKAVMVEESKDTKPTTSNGKKNAYYDAAMVVAGLFGITELKTDKDKSFYIGIAKTLLQSGMSMEEIPQYKKWVDKQSQSQGNWEVTPNSLTAKSRPALYMVKQQGKQTTPTKPSPQSSKDAAYAQVLNLIKGDLDETA